MFELLVACIDTRRQLCSERRHMETLERGPEGRGETEEIEKEIGVLKYRCTLIRHESRRLVAQLIKQGSKGVVQQDTLFKPYSQWLFDDLRRLRPSYRELESCRNEAKKLSDELRSKQAADDAALQRQGLSNVLRQFGFASGPTEEYIEQAKQSRLEVQEARKALAVAQKEVESLRCAMDVPIEKMLKAVENVLVNNRMLRSRTPDEAEDPEGLDGTVRKERDEDDAAQVTQLLMISVMVHRQIVVETRRLKSLHKIVESADLQAASEREALELERRIAIFEEEQRDRLRRVCALVARSAIVNHWLLEGMRPTVMESLQKLGDSFRRTAVNEQRLEEAKTELRKLNKDHETAACQLAMRDILRATKHAYSSLGEDVEERKARARGAADEARKVVAALQIDITMPRKIEDDLVAATLKAAEEVLLVAKRVLPRARDEASEVSEPRHPAEYGYPRGGNIYTRTFGSATSIRRGETIKRAIRYMTCATRYSATLCGRFTKSATPGIKRSNSSIGSAKTMPQICRGSLQTQRKGGSLEPRPTSTEITSVPAANGTKKWRMQRRGTSRHGKTHGP